MKTMPETIGKLISAGKFPFALFASDDSRINERLDELHRSVPSTLPEKRFFKH